MTQTLVDTGVLISAVKLACRAPSLHNSQPWLWEVRGAFTSLDYVGRARRKRAEAISHRRTDRRPFRAPRDWPSLQPVLRNCVRQEFVALDVLSDDAGGVGIGREIPTSPDDRARSENRRDQAKVVLLSTPANTRADALDCGQALSAVLLECTMAGLATCPITHVTESTGGRDILRDLTGGGPTIPQAMIRVGISLSGPIPPATPRMPLREVLHVHS